MSDPSPRPDPPARADELVETGIPAFDPLSAPPAHSGSDQSTIGNARAPTVPNTEYVPDVPGYVIVEKIGEGGMGLVFLARDAELGRDAAIKTMKPELAARPLDRARFLREARAAANLTSDHIVPILHIGEAADGVPFIAMPFLKGEMLDARLRREPLAPIDLLLKVAREVAIGLAEAHAAGLIHRDIKPANVWLEAHSTGSRCKILDFGLARSMEKEDVQLTSAGAILGTPAYMSPEQARGKELDARSDLFSLGIMLYRMATSLPPFTGDTAASVMIAIVADEPRSVRELAPDLPPELLALIERLMCKDRAERPQSAAEVVTEVAAIVRQLSAREPDYAQRTRTAVPGTLGGDPTASFGPAAPVSAILPPRTTRDHFTELAGTAALVPLVTGACAALWVAVEPWATWTLFARAFLLSTALAWAVGLVGLIPARDGWRRWARYALQFVVGAGIGVLALWCDGWNAVGADGRALPAGVGSVGCQYALYFGLAVCACRWWYDRCRALRTDGWRTIWPAPGERWRLFLAPLVLIVLLVAWPRDAAPLELAAVILVSALAAQATRPLTRSAGA